MDVSQKKEGEKKTKCHNTFHSRVFAGPFVSLYLLQDLRFQGKHSRGQAFSIDHLSMQAVWPSTNHGFTFPTYFVAAQLIVSNFTWNMRFTCKRACVHYLHIKCSMENINNQPKMTVKNEHALFIFLFHFLCHHCQILISYCIVIAFYSLCETCAASYNIWKNNALIKI